MSDTPPPATTTATPPASPTPAPRPRGRGKIAYFRCGDGEMAAWKAAAKRDDRPTQSWFRVVCNAAAGYVPPPETEE